MKHGCIVPVDFRQVHREVHCALGIAREASHFYVLITPSPSRMDDGEILQYLHDFLDYSLRKNIKIALLLQHGC